MTMSEGPSYGLSRRDLEYHLRWMLRKMPKSPSKMPQFLGEVMITLIEKNNAALAKCAAEEERVEMPDKF
jgi:hypothetical protein